MDDPETVVDEHRSARFLLVVLALLGLASILIVMPFLTGAVFALVLGFLLQRPYRWLAKRIRAPRIAAVLMVLFTVAVVVAPVVVVVMAIADDAVDAAVAIERGGGVQNATVRTLVRLGMTQDQAHETYAEGIAQLSEGAQARILPTLAKFGSAAANIGIFLFLLYFLLLEGPTFARYLSKAVPLSAARSRRLFKHVGDRVRALFLGTFLVALVQGAVAGIGWWILGFPAPIFWTFVMTILAVIPAIGPVIVMVPAGLIAIVQGDTWQGLGLIAYGAIVVSSTDNLVRPYVVGRSSGVHPAVVLLGTLGGLIFFGTTGFILGPLVLSMLEPILEEWESVRPGPG